MEFQTRVVSKSEQIKAAIIQTRADIKAAHAQIGEWTSEARKLGGRAAMDREAKIDGLQATIKAWEANISRMTESLRNIEIAEKAAAVIDAQEAQRQAEQAAALVAAKEQAGLEAGWAAWRNTNPTSTYSQFLEAWPGIKRQIATAAATEAAQEAIAAATAPDPTVQAAQDALARKYGGGVKMANKALGKIPHRIGIISANEGAK